MDTSRSGAGVDLVGEDVLGDGESYGEVQSGEKFGKCFVVAAAEHGDAIASVGGDGDGADGFQDAEGDLSVVDEGSEVGQQVGDGVLLRTLLYAAAWSGTGSFFATFQGSSSSMRWMG